MNVIAYVRVSTDGQVGEDKFGLERQEEIIKDYVSYTLEIAEFESASRIWTGALTVQEVAESAMAQHPTSNPLLTQYSNAGMMVVTSDSANPPLVDVTNMTFKQTLETVIH